MAWLAAVNCQHVVDGDRVDGTMVDLSVDGVAFATNRVLRPGDRLLFHGRFFAEHVDADVRVSSVRESAAPGRLIVGCSFVEIDPENRARVERLAARDPRPEPSRRPPSTSPVCASWRVRTSPTRWRLAPPVQEALSYRRRMGARSVSPLFMGVAIVCYLAAVVIALPLGITGVVDQADALSRSRSARS